MDCGRAFREQLGLVDKLLQGFRLFGGAAVAAIPQATVLMAAAYLVIMAMRSWQELTTWMPTPETPESCAGRAAGGSTSAGLNGGVS